MAQLSSFYNYVYNWQSIQHDTLLKTLLKSSHHIMNCRTVEDMCEFISNVIWQLQMDGYYRLEVAQQLHIEHFQNGRHVSYQGERPQKGSENRTIKVVELEHAMIFKMHFIQLYITKHADNAEILEDSKDIWLLWLMHVESVCLKVSLEEYLNIHFTEQQQIKADSFNFHLDLEVNINRLNHHFKEMHQAYSESVMSLLNPSDFIQPNKRQQLLISSVTSHQETLSSLIKQQYGLYLSAQRLLTSILDSSCHDI